MLVVLEQQTKVMLVEPALAIVAAMVMPEVAEAVLVR
jgi:hypothetical protein